jgi:uncharacterized DUF497 family protein/predicted DNA binding CopG/RHH family protein
MMLFDWDDENRTHIAAHSVSCGEAEQVINNQPFDVRFQTVNGEERFVQLGETNAGRILVVVSTWREVLIRVITAFDASRAMNEFTSPRREICMEQTLKFPEFKSEAEEAQWWVENQDQLAQQFKRAAGAGKLGRGTVAARGNTPTTTIRLDPQDIAKARFHAERKGLKYQTYLKMLIHQALHDEEIQSGPSIQHQEKNASKTPKGSGLDRRSRNEEGEIRKKRIDTLVGTLRKEYGEDFAKGYRSNATLRTVLEREGLDDLSQLLKKKRA